MVALGFTRTHGRLACQSMANHAVIPYSRIWNASMMLPQDLLVLLKPIACPRARWTYAELGEALHMSASQVHRSIGRSLVSGLAVARQRGQWQPVRPALLEFAVHGLRYVFPATVGPVRRGVPTAFAAPPLAELISAPADERPVWPHPQGSVRGPSLSPLCRNAPAAALLDARLHELLALLDALRSGRQRERELARKLFAERLAPVEQTDAA